MSLSSTTAFLNAACVLLFLSRTIASNSVSRALVLRFYVVCYADFGLWSGMLYAVKFSFFVSVPFSIVVFEPVASMYPGRATGYFQPVL